jgi:nitrite reductase/ring-hydroxylating ferredoxin subunit
VTCPWHGWRHDVTTGVLDENPSVRVACYAVTVENGVVYVEC